MISNEQAQIILDHFHVGKLESIKHQDSYYEVKTNQGTFCILESDPSTARKTEKKRSQRLHELAGKLERMLRPDYKGELQDYSSYAHKNDKYYSVYKLTK